MTLIWFVVGLICDLVGDRESLTFDPVNWRAGSLLLVIALDLALLTAATRASTPSTGPGVGRRVCGQPGP
jgi:hypothetical protein